MEVSSPTFSSKWAAPSHLTNTPTHLCTHYWVLALLPVQLLRSLVHSASLQDTACFPLKRWRWYSTSLQVWHLHFIMVTILYSTILNTALLYPFKKVEVASPSPSTSKQGLASSSLYSNSTLYWQCSVLQEWRWNCHLVVSFRKVSWVSHFTVSSYILFHRAGDAIPISLQKGPLQYCLFPTMDMTFLTITKRICYIFHAPVS